MANLIYFHKPVLVSTSDSDMLDLFTTSFSSNKITNSFLVPDMLDPNQFTIGMKFTASD
jgi:hypothetical protein